MLAFIQALLRAGAVVKFWSDCPTPRPVYEAALQARGVEVHRGGLRQFGAWISVNGAALDHVLLSRPDRGERAICRCCAAARARASPSTATTCITTACASRRLLAARCGPRARCRNACCGASGVSGAAPTSCSTRRRPRSIRSSHCSPESLRARCSLTASPSFAAAAPPGAAVRRCCSSPGSPIRRTRMPLAGWCTTSCPWCGLQAPSARLAIVGSDPTARVRALAGVRRDDRRQCRRCRVARMVCPGARGGRSAAARSGREAQGGGGTARGPAAGHHPGWRARPARPVRGGVGLRYRRDDRHGVGGAAGG